jgi:hypothetical protein
MAVGIRGLVLEGLYEHFPKCTCDGHDMKRAADGVVAVARKYRGAFFKSMKTDRELKAQGPAAVGRAEASSVCLLCVRTLVAADYVRFHWCVRVICETMKTWVGRAL